MARTAELILRLVDQVTAPARAVTAALNTVNRATNAVQQTARNLRRSATDMAGFSLPVLYVADDAARQVFEFEKVGNAIEAVTDMTTAQRESLEVLSQELNAKFPATNTEIMGAALELAKSGMQYEQIRGSLENTLQLAQAGDFGIRDSSAILIATATAMRMAMDTELDAAKSTAAVADMIAFAANRSLAEIPDIGVTMRYVASAAAATGMELDELGAITAVLAQNGIMGSNAGTGLRYSLLQLLNPSKNASDALAKLGIDLGDYVTGAQKISAVDLATNLSFDGIDITGLGIDEAIQSVLDDPAISKSPARLVAAITPLITEAMESQGGLVDSVALAQSLSDSLTVLGTQVDLRGLMNAFRENPDSEALFGAIFGKQHAVKMMALLAGDLEGMIRAFEEESAGAAARMSDKRMQGIVGEWYEMTAAIENLYLTIADAGVLSDAATAITMMGDGLQQIATVNPELLKMGTYAVLALAGLAPLGWALSGISATMAFLANPITIVAAALGYLAYLNWDKITSFFSAFEFSFWANMDADALKPLTDMVDQVKNLFKSVGAGFDGSAAGWDMGLMTANLVNQIPQVIKVFEDLRERAMPALDFVMPLLQQFGQSVGKIASMVGRLTTGLAQGAMAFFQGFADNIDPETVENIIAAATAIRGISESIWKFIGAMADEVMTDDRLGDVIYSLSRLGGLTADGLDWVVEQLANLVAYIKTFEGMDAYSIGSKLTSDFVSGLAAGLLNIGGVMSTLQRLQFALTNGAAGQSWEQQNGVPGESNYNDPSGLPVPRPDYGPVPVVPHAKGGAYSPGMILTGEKGPELQMASGHGQIFTAKETRDMLSGKSGGGGNTYNTFHVTGSNADEIVQKLTALLDRKMQRSRSIAMEDRFVTE